MPERVLAEIFERYDLADEIEDVQALLAADLRAVGFIYFACSSYVDPLKPPLGAIMMTNFPPAWVHHYHVSGHALRDPIYVTSKRQLRWFAWTSESFRADLAKDQLRILGEARDHGLKNGLTFPIHVPGAWPACCSLVYEGAFPGEAALLKAHGAAIAAHERARAIMLRDNPQILLRLTTRQREVFDLIGRGKDENSIGDILGIKPGTAHHHAKVVMRGLRVSTRMQAMMRAVADGIFHARDLIG